MKRYSFRGFVYAYGNRHTESSPLIISPLFILCISPKWSQTQSKNGGWLTFWKQLQVLNAKFCLNAESWPTEVGGENCLDLQEARMPPTEVPDCQDRLGISCLKIPGVSGIHHWPLKKQDTQIRSAGWKSWCRMVPGGWLKPAEELHTGFCMYNAHVIFFVLTAILLRNHWLGI